MSVIQSIFLAKPHSLRPSWEVLALRQDVQSTAFEYFRLLEGIEVPPDLSYGSVAFIAALLR
jgi:hypothetical protein